MNEESEINGLAKYKEKEYSFTYSKGVLKLTPNIIHVDPFQESLNKLYQDLRNYDNKIKKAQLTNIKARLYSGDNIIFYNAIHISGNDTLYFRVEYFYRGKFNSISAKGFRISRAEIKRFYMYENLIEIEELGEKGFCIKVRNNNKLEIGKYSYKGIEINILLYTHLKHSYDEYSNKNEVETYFEFYFSEQQNIDFIKEVYNHLQLFIIYITGRTNVKFGNLELFNYNEIMKRENIGIIGLSKNHNMKIAKKNDLSRIIKYQYLEGKVCELFKVISTKTMFFESFNKFNDVDYSIPKFILILTNFEREFKNLYCEENKESDFENAKEIAIFCLGNLKNRVTGKVKKYIKGFIKDG